MTENWNVALRQLSEAIIRRAGTDATGILYFLTEQNWVDEVVKEIDLACIEPLAGKHRGKVQVKIVRNAACPMLAHMAHAIQRMAENQRREFFERLAASSMVTTRTMYMLKDPEYVGDLLKVAGLAKDQVTSATKATKKAYAEFLMILYLASGLASAVSKVIPEATEQMEAA